MKGLVLADVRKNQFLFHFRNLNFIYRIGFILLIVFVLLFLDNIISNQKEAWISIALFSLLLLQFHITRKDFRFIQVNIKPSILNIQIEYLVYSIPLFIVLSIKLMFLQLIVLIGTVCFIAFIKYNRITTYSYYTSYVKIHPQMFEWRSGLKKVFYFFAVIFIISLLLTPFRLVSIFMLWILSNFISGFFASNESIQLLTVFAMDSRKLIRHKILSTLKYTYLVFVPVLIAYIFFNPADIWFVILFLFNITIYLIFVIVFKYALYEPGKDFSGNQLIHGISQLSVVIPFLLPLPAILALRFYKKAVLNLNQYL